MEADCNDPKYFGHDNNFISLKSCRIWIIVKTAQHNLKRPTGGVQIIGRNSRFFDYFVTKTKKNTKKNTLRFKVNSSSIRQYTFCLEIQSIN